MSFSNGITLVSHDDLAAREAWGDPAPGHWSDGTPTEPVFPEDENVVKVNPLREENPEDADFSVTPMFNDSKMRNFRSMTSTMPAKPVTSTTEAPRLRTTSVAQRVGISAREVLVQESPMLDTSGMLEDYMVTPASMERSKWRNASDDEIRANVHNLSLAVSADGKTSRPSALELPALGGDVEYDVADTSAPLYDTVKFSPLMEAEEVSFRVSYHGSTTIQCESHSMPLDIYIYIY